MVFQFQTAVHRDSCFSSCPQEQKAEGVFYILHLSVFSVSFLTYFFLSTERAEGVCGGRVLYFTPLGIFCFLSFIFLLVHRKGRGCVLGLSVFSVSFLFVLCVIRFTHVLSSRFLYA